MKDKVVLIMGSSKDEEFSRSICAMLKKFGFSYEIRVCSAHKAASKLLKMIGDYEKSGDRIVYITVAGRSNALSGLVDANTRYPVIACPPPSEKFGLVDLFSSLRMPSGVAPLVVLEPENAVFAVAKIFALSNPEINVKILNYHQLAEKKIEMDDDKIRNREM